MENGNCRRFILFGVGAVVLMVMAFLSGANALGMMLVAAAIISFGYGAGTVMNTPTPTHDE